MRDAVRGYLSIASGLTEVPRRRAVAAVKALLAQGEATAEQVSQLTDDLLATSRSNREALSSLIRYEVDRTLDQMGLGSSDKVRALTARVAALEALFRASQPAPAKKAAKKTAAKKTVSKKTPAKKAPAKRGATAGRASAKS